ncbi:MDR family NADP-dependent oxidoreductase [Streptomyces sp. NPDC004365]
MHTTHRFVRLVRRPAGLPSPDDFTLAQAPVPKLQAGQVLIRNTHFLVFPGLRTLIGGETRDVPLPPLRPGDTVFVTGAAGAVGTLAGQIARLLGAARVIGSTGSPDKARRLKRELGYDAVVLRGAGPIGSQLSEAAPDGIDIALDTVGGEQLTAAVHAANRGARFALVGALDGQLSPERAGGSAPAVVDTYRLLTKGIRIAGYNGVDHPDVEAEWEARFGDWLRAGNIQFPYTAVHGMESAPEALPRLIAGRSFGAAIVEL